MKFVFCYDISDQRRLGKIARRMEKYGIRVQYSIFEVDTTYTGAKKILKELEGIMNIEEDRIYVFPMEDKDYQNAKRIGKLENVKIF